MFGLSFSGQLIQGSAERTWNCISQVVNLVWYKVNNYRQPIMPRSRRKHHSRSRSRSHSHDKDRDAKRRKIEQYDSPNQKRSVSPPIDPKEEQVSHLQEHPGTEDKKCVDTSADNMDQESDSSSVMVLSDLDEGSEKAQETDDAQIPGTSATPSNKTAKILTTPSSKPAEIFATLSSKNSAEGTEKDSDTSKTSEENLTTPSSKPAEIFATPSSKNSAEGSKKDSDTSKISEENLTTPVSTSVKKLFPEKTPNRKLTPKQLEKRLESEKKRILKEKEKEEREKQRQLEKEQKEAEKQKKKEQKQKEIELKLKEIEQKRKEKEEKEEQKKQEKELKLKQKEEEKMRRQQEIDDKNKEKLKEEEKKQKAAAAFVSFFVPKKVDSAEDKKTEEISSIFMPFEVKCDMKLPPLRREPLTTEEKQYLDELLRNNNTDSSYLKDLSSSKKRSCQRTWIYRDIDDDVIVVEDEILLGEKICEEKSKSERMRVKLLQFHENQRPAYYGTWRKKSKNIKSRRPWGKEDIFDYEVDSDDDWEEEEQGENLEVVSDEEKENEPENEDYEVDNEFFVPHGHLSDDEVDDEEHTKLSPESQKQKLKLLKDAFDQDIKSKTQKIKPRSIGCIWYNKYGNNIDEAIVRYLNPLNIIISARIEIKKRGVNDTNMPKKKKTPKPLPENLMGILAKLVHGNLKKREKLAIEFLDYIQTNNMGIELSKTNVAKQISNIAKWTWNVEKKAFHWIINEEVADKYNIDYVLPVVQIAVDSK